MRRGCLSVQLEFSPSIFSDSQTELITQEKFTVNFQRPDYQGKLETSVSWQRENVRFGISPELSPGTSGDEAIERVVSRNELLEFALIFFVAGYTLNL